MQVIQTLNDLTTGAYKNIKATIMDWLFFLKKLKVPFFHPIHGKMRHVESSLHCPILAFNV